MENIVRRSPSRGRRCSFTGYRPQKMPFVQDEADPRFLDFKERLRNTVEMLILQDFKHFISSGAMGMDIWAAETVKALQTKYPEITLEMVSPFDGQADKWSDEYKERHNRLFAEADVVTVTGHKYTKSCMFTRNRYLVANADLLLAAFDGKQGGTAMTVEYAKKMRVQVLCIPPLPIHKASPITAMKERGRDDNII